MGENKQRMMAGEWFLAQDEELGADTVRRTGLLDAYNAAGTTGPERAKILGELLGSVGDDVRIRPPFHCDFGYRISVGPRTFVNFNAVFLDTGAVTIGADCQIGPN